MNKNYQVSENDMQRVFFCQLQVSNRFRRTMDPFEAELIDWIVATFVHRAGLVLQDFDNAVGAIRKRVQELNAMHEANGPFLVVTSSPVRRFENGFIRIERTAGRHQSLLLPVIDYRGSVEFKV